VQEDESKQHQTPTAEPQYEESKQIQTPTKELRVEESKQHPTSTPELQDEGSKQHQTPTSKLQDDVSDQQPTPVSELQEEELKQHPTQTLEQTQAVPPKQVKVPNRVSSRQKKMPATKSDDFFMVDSARRTGDSSQLKDREKCQQTLNNQHINTYGKWNLYNLRVYYQNVRGLKGKLNLLSIFLYSELPHIVCLTEHHLNDQEINLASMEHYKLSAKFCRQQYRNGGTCIFVHESVNCDIIHTDHICKEKDLEMCAIKLNLPKTNIVKTNIVIIVIYKSPSGNYNYFLRKLELFLKSL
jgi:hypothetical protein